MSQRLPTLTPAELIKTLEKAGFNIVQQSGSHVIMHKEGLLRPIAIPKHPKALKRNLQHRIIKEAGFTAKEFSSFL